MATALPGSSVQSLPLDLTDFRMEPANRMSVLSVLSVINSSAVNDALVSVQSIRAAPATHNAPLTGIAAVTISSNTTR